MGTPDRGRLERQIAFVVEIDRLKQIARQTLLMDGSRYENDAEHSWHLAMMVLLLAEYADPPVTDLFRVVRMVLVHDLVEILAGDTFCYDDAAAAGQHERERAAAETLFGKLPADQAADFRGLWDEFEARKTVEARFAAALDRVHPILHNLQTQGAAWRQHGVTKDRVLARNRHIAEGAPALWEYVQERIEEAARKGHLPEAPAAEGGISPRTQSIS